MKMGINRIQKILLLIIAVLAVILAALLVSKGYNFLQEKKQEKEWAVRHQEVQTELVQVQQQIQELSGDAQALQVFLDEKVNQAVVVENEESAKEEASEAGALEEGNHETIALEERHVEETVVEAIVIQETVTEETSAGEIVIGEIPQGDAISEEKAREEVISNAIIIEAPQSAPTRAEEVPEWEEEPVTYAGEAIIIDQPEIEPSQPVTISGNASAVESEEETVSSISGNAVVNGQIIPYRPVQAELTLEQRRALRSSYEETIAVNEVDKAVINRNTLDFSDKKIACLGDSLTEGSNLDDLENYQQYSYPSVLKRLLNAEEVYNLGIGGSSYGRYWEQAFVDRYKEIPQDADIILIMGGTNDGFAASDKELGSLEEKAPRTYYGDVDELMRGLKADYPNAKIIFVTPLPNILHDYLRSEREYLLPQQVFADAIKELAAQHQIDVIDLYHSNILDTHDAQVISNYMPDGVHGNQAGYQILAEHIAKEMIQIMEQDAREQHEQEQGSVSANSIVYEMETVSGNEGFQADEVPTYVGETIAPTYASEESDYQYGDGAIVIH